MRLNYIKNYFMVWILTYITIIGTKFIFIYYLKESFDEFGIANLVYAIFWGYKFDFATSAIVALLVTLFDFNKKVLSLLSAMVITLVFFIQIGDILYFNESSRHIGYEITDTFTDASSLFMTAYSQHTTLTLLSLFLGFLLFVSILFLKFEKVILTKSYILKKIMLILISVFFIRGMTQHIPLTPWQSNQIGNNKLATVSLNATYNIIYSLANRSKKLKRVKIPTVSSDSIKESFQELYRNERLSRNLPIVKTKPNIVFLFLESWSLKYVTPQITPNYYKLLKQSIHPKYMIASGHRTTEGIFATLVSFQNPLGKSVAKTQLQNYSYTSIIDILNQEGYNSSFFQGTAKDTSGTGSLANSLGFKESYGKRDVKKRIYEENYWGIHDVDLYNFAFSKLKEPFTIGINGATTHDNKIPKGITPINFTHTKLDAQLNVFHFSDDALGKFIDRVEEKYPNTIFVLFADHCGGGLSGTLENYEIPFAIYSKKLIKPKEYNTILSQRDIAPTIMDLAIGDYKKQTPNFSGKSLLSDNVFFADYFHNGILGWIENNNLIEINSATNKMRCFNLNGLKKESVNCSKMHQNMKNHALSFTNVSQALLFSGETDKFMNYRNLK